MPKPTNVIVPGYTVLVIDTNLLLSSLSTFASLVESLRWTVIIPLSVIMELDGLATSDSPQLVEASKAALSFISSNLKSSSTSLEVQTSRGNYLSSLNTRMGQVDFGAHLATSYEAVSVRPLSTAILVHVLASRAEYLFVSQTTQF